MKDKTVESFSRRKQTVKTDSAILQRVAGSDKEAVKECVEKYGGVIWSLAKHYTNSKIEAEAACLEIFREIWKCARQFENAGCEELIFIRLLAYRKLINKTETRDNP